jgi:DNA polymerase-3 subunit delta'
MESGNYPDFVAVEPEDPARPSLKVDQIRALERFLYLTPNESVYKIAIVAPFEVATISAANALLKTLEEPPPYAHLILLASDAETLLPTIVSRTQQLALRPLDRGKIQRALMDRWHVSEQQAERLARLSGGRLGWAVQAATDTTYLERMRTALQTLFNLLDSDLPSRFDKAKVLAKDTEQLVEFLEYWQAGWRDILLLQANTSSDEGNVRGLVYREELQTLARAARYVPVQASVRTLKRLKEAQAALHQNANTQLLVENLLLNLPCLV